MLILLAGGLIKERVKEKNSQNTNKLVLANIPAAGLSRNKFQKRHKFVITNLISLKFNAF